DPFYADQWHLNNDGTKSSSVSGEDAKVQAVWNSGNYGADVLVAVVDDGVEVAHEDLKDNVSSAVAGYNYVNNTTNPSHTSSSSGHGTNVAGVIAAKMKNGLGLRGAAPCAKLTGRNILESNLTTSIISDSMTKDIASIAISNNSWGATDSTGQYADSMASTTWKSAIDTGVTTGRGGKGTLYLWAAGNGSEPLFPSQAALEAEIVDNSNHDGQANYHGVLAIGGIGINGKKAAYSEKGANLWVVAHTQGNSSSAYTSAISTTDPTGTAGFNTGSDKTNYSNAAYNNSFNGTSSATPLAAGVIALLLKADSALSWRDVREILAKSARKNDSTDTDWAVNGGGYNVNHKYGFGAIDANAAVT
ncbi:MAG TPA: S8 family serine peptidase, partial [Leptospiraceae bacterium]|nr:S8 family serine peptidase [Leptospiraceae bacterium]